MPPSFSVKAQWLTYSIWEGMIRTNVQGGAGIDQKMAAAFAAASRGTFGALASLTAGDDFETHQKSRYFGFVL